MQPEIKSLYRIQDGDYEKLFSLLLDAFKNYEKLIGAFPDWNDRQAAVEMVIAYYLAYDWKYGAAYSLDERINEVIVSCYSDEMDYSDKKIEAAGCENKRFKAAAARLTDEQVKFWYGFFDELDRQERALDIPKPHIYVDYVAVSEEMQGKGRGSEIIEKLKEFSREQGLPIMLFTNGEEDVKFYLKNGFRILGVTRSEEFCMKNTYMLYEPG